VGSKGRKPRKPSHSKHLDKVGAHNDFAREQHEERQAIADVMGLGNASPWVRTALVAIATVVLVAAVVSLIFVVLF
jgi:hypothetical protein